MKVEKISIIKDGVHNGKAYTKGKKILVREWLADELIKAKIAQKVYSANTKELDVEGLEQMKVQSAIEELKTKEEKFNKRKTK